MKTLIIVPAKREYENLPKLAKQLELRPGNTDVLIINDNTWDGTDNWIRRYAGVGSRKKRFLTFIQRPLPVTGLRSAYIEGFLWAIDKKYEAIALYDADCQWEMPFVSDLKKTLETGFDIALGSRYSDGICVSDWPISTLVFSIAAGKIASFCTRMPFADPFSSLLAIRTSVLKSIDFSRLTSEGHAFRLELLYEARKNGAKITEVCAAYWPRREGRSKMGKYRLRTALATVTLPCRYSYRNLLNKFRNLFTKLRITSVMEL